MSKKALIRYAKLRVFHQRKMFFAYSFFLKQFRKKSSARVDMKVVRLHLFSPKPSFPLNRFLGYGQISILFAFGRCTWPLEDAPSQTWFQWLLPHIWGYT